MNFDCGKWCRLPVLCVLLLCLPGCWDYQKINERAQIIGIGVDPVDGAPNLMSYTLQIPVLDSGGGGGGDAHGGPSKESSGEAGAYRNFTVQARGVNEAVTLAQTQYAKMFYLGNLQTVILNRHLTPDQVRHTITEMIRTPFLDKLAWLLFANEPAQDILHAPGTTAPADEIDSFLGSSVRLHGLTTRTRLWEFWRDASSTGIDPRAGMIRTQKTGLQMYGILTFDKTRPDLELTSQDALYFTLIDGRVERLTMWVEDGPRAFEVQNVFSGSRISVSMENSTPVLHVKLSANAMLAQDESGGAKDVTEGEMRRYEAVMEKQLVTQSVHVMQQFQQRHIDVFGFGEYVYTHHMTSKSYVEQQWPEAFARAQLDIQAKVTLVQKGVLM